MNYLQWKKKALLNSVRKKESGYIQSGLIAMYDGLNNTRLGHNSNPDKWEDLSGNGNDLTLQGITFGSDKAILKGNAGQIAYCDNAIEPVVTAEIVIKISAKNYSYIAEFNRSAKKILCMTTDYKGIIISHPAEKRFSVDNSIVNVLSINYSNQSVWRNGKILRATVYADRWPARALHDIQIGRYANTDLYIPQNEIYSIRLYNRELSESERLHNYQIDNQRFLNGGN